MEKEYSIKQIVVELQYTHRPKKKKKNIQDQLIQYSILNLIE